MNQSRNLFNKIVEGKAFHAYFLWLTGEKKKQRIVMSVVKLIGNDFSVNNDVL